MVDQAHPTRTQPLELAVNVLDLVRDVMKPGAVTIQEPAHGRLARERPEQLDMALPHIQQDALHTLLHHRLAVNHRQPERLTVERERGLQVANGDPDVVNAREHRRGHNTP